MLARGHARFRHPHLSTTKGLLFLKESLGIGWDIAGRPGPLSLMKHHSIFLACLVYPLRTIFLSLSLYPFFTLPSFHFTLFTFSLYPPRYQPSNYFALITGHSSKQDVKYIIILVQVDRR